MISIQNMNDAILIDVTTQTFNGLGRHSFKQLPRIGEKLSITSAGVTTIYDVVMLVHNSDAAGCDIFVTRSAETLKDYVHSVTH
jgi:hypothetical protein